MKEGFDEDDDDQHTKGELMCAAVCYVRSAFEKVIGHIIHGTPPTWPWDAKWWKPTTPIRDLTKAGALIAAEIDRLQRIEHRKEKK